MSKGYLSIVLHAHLPFIRHPEYDDFLEEDWLFEAVIETYIPLIRSLRALRDDGVHHRFVLSISPPLAEMFADGLLQSRIMRHINKLVELAEKECIRTTRDPDFLPLAEMYLQHFKYCRTVMESCDLNLNMAFKDLMDNGDLEIITCAGTHGFLPLMEPVPEAARAQIRLGVNTYRKHFGRDPAGMWLPECAYAPFLDEYLAEAKLKYFFLDSHGILLSAPRPKFGLYAPVMTDTGVSAFGRDPESSKSVWSSKEGYPGDYYYREFYRDIGWDLPIEYIGPYIGSNKERKFTGIKYYRITGQKDHKEPYNPGIADEHAAMHADNFLFNRKKQVEHLAQHMDRKPIIVAPYDAELFGHWWYEGPRFLEMLARKIHFDQDTVSLATPSDYLEQYKVIQKCKPNRSTWGDKGHCEVWLDESNDWIYKHLLNAAESMLRMANEHPHAQGQMHHALNMAARQLFLAQASDWAFIMKNATMVEYAILRTRRHISRFLQLQEMIDSGNFDTDAMHFIEQQDTAFADMDYRIYL